MKSFKPISAGFFAFVVGALVPATFVAGAGLLGAVGIGPLVGPGYSDCFLVSCGTTPTLIQSPFGQVGYNATVDDLATVDVFFGDSAVTTAIGDPKGAGESIGGAVRKEYCIVAATATTVRVRALTSSNESSLVGQAMESWARLFSPEMFANRIDG